MTPRRPLVTLLAKTPRSLARFLIRTYQLTLSGLVGRGCRYSPSCSAYADDAIARHGLWAGGWMGAARFCRCRPFGGEGYDPAPREIPAAARAYAPWRYGAWRQPLFCEPVSTRGLTDNRSAPAP